MGKLTADIYHVAFMHAPLRPDVRVKKCDLEKFLPHSLVPHQDINLIQPKIVNYPLIQSRMQYPMILNPGVLIFQGSRLHQLLRAGSGRPGGRRAKPQRVPPNPP